MRKAYTIFAILLLTAMLLASCAAPQAPAPVPTEAPVVATEAPAAMEKIVVGWTPPDITGVFKTATDFFEKSLADGAANGVESELITQAVTSHTQFADQVAIIEDFIQREVDVIAVSPIELEVIKPALKKANEAGIPVIMVNLLEPQTMSISHLISASTTRLLQKFQPTRCWTTSAGRVCSARVRKWK